MATKQNQKSTIAPPRSIAERYLILAPLIFIITLLPLVMHYHEYDPKLADFDWYSFQTSADDFFLYWKMWLFTAVSALMLCIIIYRTVKNKKTLKFSKLFIPLGIYALLSLLSTLFSEYSSFGFSGIYEQFQNIWSLLGYALLPYYCYLMLEAEEDVKLMLNALLIGSALLGLLGLSQAAGYDFWTTSLGGKLIYPREQWGAQISLVFGKKRVYLAQYNPNYVGVYVGLVAPIIMTLLFFCKNLKKSIIYFAVLIALLISMFASQSKAGFIGIAAAIVIILLLLRKSLIKRWYIIVPTITVAIISFFIVNHINDNQYIHAITNAFKVTKAEPFAVSGIKTNDDNIEITYKGNTFFATLFTQDDELSIGFFDSESTEIAADFNGETSTFLFIDSRFEGIEIQPILLDDVLGLRIYMDGKDWYFTNQLGDNTYYYMNVYGKFVKIIPHKPVLFEGYEAFASGRGFIWSHTIPLLKDYFILGSGADTFAIAYPQSDYVNLKNNLYDTSLITKPHCLYLQMGVETGTLSLIAYLAFYLLYFIWSLRIYLKQKFDTFTAQFGAAIFVGTISYMILGISNDSSITTAPVFWTLIGVGIALNKMAENAEKDKENLA